MGIAMAEVRVRNLDDWVVGWFRSQAKQHGRSLESELRQMLKDIALERKRLVADRLRADLQELEKKYGKLSDSSTLIREDREARG
jgi:plasmid stability protein